MYEAFLANIALILALPKTNVLHDFVNRQHRVAVDSSKETVIEKVDRFPHDEATVTIDRRKRLHLAE